MVAYEACGPLESTSREVLSSKSTLNPEDMDGVQLSSLYPQYQEHGKFSRRICDSQQGDDGNENMYTFGKLRVLNSS